MIVSLRIMFKHCCDKPKWSFTRSNLDNTYNGQEFNQDHDQQA